MKFCVLSSSRDLQSLSFDLFLRVILLTRSIELMSENEGYELRLVHDVVELVIHALLDKHPSLLYHRAMFRTLQYLSPYARGQAFRIPMKLVNLVMTVNHSGLFIYGWPVRGTVACHSLTAQRCGRNQMEIVRSLCTECLGTNERASLSPISHGRRL